MQLNIYISKNVEDVIEAAEVVKTVREILLDWKDITVSASVNEPIEIVKTN